MTPSSKQLKTPPRARATTIDQRRRTQRKRTARRAQGTVELGAFVSAIGVVSVVALVSSSAVGTALVGRKPTSFEMLKIGCGACSFCTARSLVAVVCVGGRVVSVVFRNHHGPVAALACRRRHHHVPGSRGGNRPLSLTLALARTRLTHPVLPVALARHRRSRGGRPFFPADPTPPAGAGCAVAARASVRRAAAGILQNLVWALVHEWWVPWACLPFNGCAIAAIPHYRTIFSNASLPEHQGATMAALGILEVSGDGVAHQDLMP